DIVGNVVKYGNFSEKQVSYVKVLLEKIDARATREAQRQLEKENAQPCPIGRVSISGTVLSTKYQASDFGNILKMLVKAEEGYLVFGSVPASISTIDEKGGGQRLLKHGDKVMFTALVTPSKDDTKFGFFKILTKASLVPSEEETQLVELVENLGKA